jgi:phosphinothricin acetyltransferase
MRGISIRRAEQADLPALLEVYNHYILNSPITFDIAPRTLEQRQAWFAGFASSGRYQCLVAVEDGQACGWASSHPYNERAAYETTISTTIYLAPEARGQGSGRKLYGALFEALEGADIHRIFAGITLPNAASVTLHRSFGFEEIGIYREVGRKFGRFWDVAAYLKPFGAKP